MRSARQVPTARISGDDAARESVVRLRNGAAVRVRPIRPDDEPRLLALCQRLSPRTVYQRFFSFRPLRPEDAHAFANVDYRERMAVVAEVDTGHEPQLIGVARYAPSAEEAIADIALVVEDGWQGLGLGPILLDAVLRAGEARGIQRFRAYVLADNYRMLKLLNRHAHVIERRLEDGVVSLLFRPKPPEATAASP